MREGPSEKIIRRCEGCKYLHTEDWSYQEENDGVDSGTDARCLKAENLLSSYWRASDQTPIWCPFITPPSHSPEA